MPTFNRRDVVVDAVKALSALRYAGKIDVIVVVDGSADGTAESLAPLQLPFPFRVITQPNHGAASARNRGAAEATGDVILFLDDDMMARPDLVEQHARTYSKGADAVVGQIDSDPLSPPGFLTDCVVRWIGDWQVGSELTPFDVFTGQLSVRRSVFRELGGFDEGYTSDAHFGHEDTDFGVRLLARYRVRHNPEAISCQRYVVSPRELMNRCSRGAVADLRFAASHPQLAAQLFEYRGVTRARTRFLIRPLSRVPLVSRATAAFAVRLAEVGLRSRFRSNPLLKNLFVLGQALQYWSAVHTAASRRGASKLLVLCYHAIADQSGDAVLAPYGIPPERFVEHLDFLSSVGFSFVSPGALANFLRYGAPLPRRAVLLSFDDGYADLLDIARNVLHPRGIGAISFAVTGMQSGTNEWDQACGAAPVRLLTAQELRELASLGVEIGSHSRTHREMPLLDPSEQQDEARGSAVDLAEAGVAPPRFFAYPFGSGDEGSERAAQDAGYLAAFGCMPDFVTVKSNRFKLPRVGVFASDRGWRFRAKVRAPRAVSELHSLRQRFSRHGA
jgi:glycosyltransferase involved in cell wall biosynthesis/peptidoglycan/xylan/chitin deacetylase (PgdA/CDA1 family)